MPTALRVALSSFGLVALVSAGGCEGAERNEAQLLLARLARVEDDGPVALRRRALDEVSRLGLAAPEVVRVRDACVRAHDALLTAEQEQESAKSALERATTTGAQLAPDAAERIAASIARSDEAIARSRALFPACQDGQRSLALRFGGRASGR
jgi:hypothetical protein